MSGFFCPIDFNFMRILKNHTYSAYSNKEIKTKETGNNNKKPLEGNTCVHTWMQGGEDVSLAGYLRGTFVVNVNSELVRLLNGRRRNGNVSYDNVGAFLPEYSSLGLNHSVLFGVVAQNCRRKNRVVF